MVNLIKVIFHSSFTYFFLVSKLKKLLFHLRSMCLFLYVFAMVDKSNWILLVCEIFSTLTNNKIDTDVFSNTFFPISKEHYRKYFADNKNSIALKIHEKKKSDEYVKQLSYFYLWIIFIHSWYRKYKKLVQSVVS